MLHLRSVFYIPDHFSVQSVPLVCVHQSGFKILPNLASENPSKDIEGNLKCGYPRRHVFLSNVCPVGLCRIY
jgi:hypothetical protein